MHKDIFGISYTVVQKAGPLRLRFVRIFCLHLQMPEPISTIFGTPIRLFVLNTT